MIDFSLSRRTVLQVFGGAVAAGALSDRVRSSTTNQINYDETVSGTVDDTWTFEADEGDRISIDARIDDPWDNEVEIRLLRPDGESVSVSRGNAEEGNAVISLYTVERGRGGEYAIDVTDSFSSENATFGYELSLYEGIPTDEEISYSESAESELTRDNRYYDDFYINGYHETYSFEANEDDEVTIEMRPENELDDDAQLVLYDPNGDRVTFDTSQSGEDGNAVITLYGIERDQSGQYTIVATGDSATDLFEYELSLYEGVPINEMIDYGESVESELTRDNRYYDSFYINGYHETYGFEANEDDEVTIEMRPKDELNDDAQLVLYDPNGDRVTFDTSQSGEDGNAVITLYGIGRDQSGEYTIVATGRSDTDLFEYELSLYEAIPTDEEINYGDSVESELTRDNRYYDDFYINGYHETYDFEANEDDQVTIEMRPENESSDSAQLVLYDSNGDRVVSDTSQFGEDGNAVITLQELDRDGIFTIVATGRSATDLFEYELSLYEGLPIDETINYGDSVESEFTRGDRYYNDFYINGYHETYAFEAKDDNTVTIRMRPEDELNDNAQLALYDPNGDRVANDISQRGSGGTALIDEHNLEMDGTHIIVTTGNSAADLFAYSLELILNEGTKPDDDPDGGSEPVVVGNNPATDTTGNGLLNDVNGDGEFTITDVQVFFENLENNAVQENADKFDFSGSGGDATIADVQALFERL